MKEIKYIKFNEFELSVLLLLTHKYLFDIDLGFAIMDKKDKQKINRLKNRLLNYSKKTEVK